MTKGDWVEGIPPWWRYYVFAPQVKFWRLRVQPVRSGSQTDPWRDAATTGLLEAIAGDAHGHFHHANDCTFLAPIALSISLSLVWKVWRPLQW